ncbi:MAG: UDP-N-acetylmuramoyl-tripeptide-D-alanyl-D-alanine ligase [Parcubacteria group bacterium GW2011_GWC1_38_6]|nr:MAG: UDP-N-acetylmuramoyl-tripeptide-D-alanyl-D-alanine ligase [Parcubacteria group bacterium GW2011_GWC1_38_6]
MNNQLDILFFILAFLWIIKSSRAFLFWIYLWQLKDYHSLRFLDHFRTEKGKKLLLGVLPTVKAALLIYALILPRTDISIWQLYAVWIFVLMAFYIVEIYKFVREIISRTLKIPVFTVKTIALGFLALLIQAAILGVVLYKFYYLQSYIYWFALYLLLFDVLMPIIATITVLFVHFFTVIFFRNKVISLAKQKRQQFKNLTVIGITGSYGKTSTKEFLYQILSSKLKVIETKENKNSEVGISQTILNDLKEGCEVFIVEMGAYNKNGIKLLSDIIQPKIGIVAGVNEQHLATFGTMENLLSAEGGEELLNNLPADGTAIFNGNNEYCLSLAKKINIKKKIATVSKEDYSDIWAENVETHKDSLIFNVRSKNNDFAAFKVGLIGSFNIENLLLAISGAKELGMSLGEISAACRNILPMPGQMELKTDKNGVSVINSTYSANPNSVIAHLEHLKHWEGQKVIIMPSLIELGKASDFVHNKIGKKIGEVCDFAIIVAKEQFKNIKQGAIQSGMDENKIVNVDQKEKILHLIQPYFDSKNVILLEGRLEKGIVSAILRK